MAVRPAPSALSIAQKRLRELALRARHSDSATFTRFLEPSAQAQLRAAAREANVHCALSGGYENAERCIAAFYTQEAPERADYPLVCLELRWNARYADPCHRDLLGAVMGLGLERDSTGDIAMGEEAGCAYLFAHSDVCLYILDNLTSAGRASIKPRLCADVPRIRPPQGLSLRITVGSPRLDAILSGALKLSRGEAQRLIEAGLVKRNHIEVLREDLRIEAGDLLSVRGYGRLRVEGFEGITRKGREAVRLFRYTG